jgi:hypothetical protein
MESETRGFQMQMNPSRIVVLQTLASRSMESETRGFQMQMNPSRIVVLQVLASRSQARGVAGSACHVCQCGLQIGSRSPGSRSRESLERRSPSMMQPIRIDDDPTPYTDSRNPWSHER